MPLLSIIQHRIASHFYSIVVFCCTLLYSVLLCSIMFYYFLLCSIMFYYVLLCSIIFYYVLLCSIMFYSNDSLARSKQAICQQQLYFGMTRIKHQFRHQNIVTTVAVASGHITMMHISADWKVSEQCGIAARKGNQLIGMIKINITHREKNLIIPLYKSIVRPHLEYCIQAWIPHLKKYIDKLERVQRRATKLIPELRIISYEDRVQQCKLTTLETRRVRGDQIEVFKGKTKGTPLWGTHCLKVLKHYHLRL